MRHLDDGALQAWLDGPRSGLGPERLGEMEAHLTGCAECRRRLEGLEALDLRVEEILAEPEGPAGDFRDVLARAERFHARGRRRSAWVSVAWAASVVAAMGVGWAANGMLRPAPMARSVDSAMEDGGAPTALPAAGDTGITAPALADAATLRETERPAAAVADVAVEQGRPEADPARVARPAPAEEPVRVAEAPGAHGPAVVRGRVTDAADAPLASAQVFVEGTQVGVLTRADGTFELRLPPALADTALRSLTVVAQIIGYGESRRELDLRGGDSASADFRLQEQAVALDAIVVTGQSSATARTALGAAIASLSAADAEGRDWIVAERGEVEAVTGFSLLTVAGLPVVEIRVAVEDTTVVVHVFQELEDGGILELAQGLDAAAVEEGGTLLSGARVERARGRVHVLAVAPVPVRELEALLERLR